ncbi:MAG: cobalamin-dependent protein [Pseudomonadota bacterium]
MTNLLRILAYKPGPARQTVGMQGLVCCEPLELEWLYTYLEGYDVTLLDGMTDDTDPVALARVQRVEVVLLTAFITHVEVVRELAVRFAKLDSPPRVFVGGPHAEVCPEHFFFEGVHGVFMANQLEAVAEVTRRVAAGKNFSDVGGLCAPSATGWTTNPASPLDPATLRAPRRVLLEKDPDAYFYLHHPRCASVKTAFGCHEKCSFCFCTAMHGGRYGPRPLDAVIDEIAELSVNNVFILDDNFLSSERRVQDFIARARERGLAKHYIVYGDAAFIASHEALIAEFVAVGLRSVIVGFESIDDDELGDMNKRARRVDNDRTVEICHTLGLELIALFIADPAWQPWQFKQLARYIRQQKIPFAMFSTRTVLPGTALAKGRAFGQDTSFWRYDFLRLTEKPRHMTRLGYYLRLFGLYLVPNLGGQALGFIRRELGVWGTLRLTLRSLLSGVELLYKLIRWG